MMKVLIGEDKVMVDTSGKMLVFSQLAWSYLGEAETEGRHEGDIQNCAGHGLGGGLYIRDLKSQNHGII